MNFLLKRQETIRNTDIFYVSNHCETNIRYYKFRLLSQKIHLIATEYISGKGICSKRDVLKLFYIAIAKYLKKTL